MILRYEGPHDAVEIETADGARVTCLRGESVDVPDETVDDRIAAGFVAAKASTQKGEA